MESLNPKPPEEIGIEHGKDSPKIEAHQRTKVALFGQYIYIANRSCTALSINLVSWELRPAPAN